jgi:hypothetical protein
MLPKMLTVTLALGVLAMSWQAAKAERPHPRRYERGSYAQYIIKKRPGKQATVSQVYNGYASRFQPPAFLYYGYPHSGDETGIGPLDRK